MKKIKNILSVLLVIVFSIVLISCTKSLENNRDVDTTTKTVANAAQLSGGLKIHYIDVGQGDSELIQIGDKNILIDAGTSDRKALDYLK
ncbi:MAG: MBL fold metallo-hydrolase, partial [Clostridium saccharoperbutylacetonicum]